MKAWVSHYSMSLHTAVLISLFAMNASAAQYVDAGDYRIHFTTFSSTIIPGQVAAAHNIVRAKNRIVLNISARKQDQPVAARIKGQVINLLNQRFELKFEEVREAEAIYYLANHLSLEQDILKFEIEVTLEDDLSVPIRFLRRYD